MAMIDGMLAELEQEATTTRRVLERVPQEHLAWKPHPKSMSLGQLALHVAMVPGSVAETGGDRHHSRTAGIRAAGSGHRRRTRAGAVGEPREGAARARWLRRCKDGRDVAAAERRTDIMAMPRAAFVRSIMLNHWYHHRGQLLVYLRLLDLPVPSVYGPTADENPFAA